jgi:MFS family permease
MTQQSTTNVTATETADKHSAGTLPAGVKLLGAASFLNDIASEMIFPLLPQFLIGMLGGNRFHLGIIEGIGESTASLLKLFSGAWSDRIGRRRFVIAGYALAAVARPLAGLTFAPWQLLTARVADRVGKGIRTSPRDALIAELAPPAIRGRAFGYQRAMDHLGAAIGPLLAAAFLWVWPDNLRTLFLLTAVPGIAVVTMLFWKLREPTSEQDAINDTPKLTFTLLPFSWSFRLYLLALAVYTLGNSSDAFLLVRAGELGVPTYALPLLWCAFHVVKSSTNLLAGRAVDRFGPRPLLLSGWLMYAVVYFSFAAATAAWHVWPLFLAYGLFFSLSEPAEKTLVIMLAGSESQGLAFGWFNFAIGVAALPSSLLFGWIYEQYGAVAAFGWGAGLALLASLLLAVATSTRLIQE